MGRPVPLQTEGSVGLMTTEGGWLTVMLKLSEKAPSAQPFVPRTRSDPLVAPERKSTVTLLPVPWITALLPVYSHI